MMSVGQAKKTRKYCIVPCCTNNSNRTPEKIFIRLPGEQKRRSLWLSAIHRHPADFSTKTCAFICEDHFNLEHDMLNYEEYKSGIGKIRMRSDVMPHIFSEEWRQQSLIEPVELTTPKRRTSRSYTTKSRFAQQSDYNYSYLQYENESEITTTSGDFDDIDSMTSYDEVEYVYVKPDTTDDYCDTERNDSTQENTTASSVAESVSNNKESSNSTVSTPPNLTDLDQKVRTIIEQQKEQIEQEKMNAKDSPKGDSVVGKEQSRETVDESERNPVVVENVGVKTTPDNGDDGIKKDEQYLNYTPSTLCQSDIDVQFQYQNNPNDPSDDYIKNEFSDSLLGPDVGNQLNQIPELPEVTQGLPDLLELSQLPELEQISDIAQQFGDVPRLPDVPQITKQIPEMTQQMGELQQYFPTPPQNNQPGVYPNNGYVNGTFQNIPQYTSALDYVPEKQYNFPNEPYQNRYYNGYRGPHINNERLSQFPYPPNFPHYPQTQMMHGYNNNNYYPQQNILANTYATMEKPQQYWPNQTYHQNYPLEPSYVNSNLVPRSPDAGLPPSPYMDDMNRPNQWFKCDMCNQSFMGKYALYRHYKTHTSGANPYMSDTAANPYRCNICTRTFLYSSNLQYHLLTHRNY